MHYRHCITRLLCIILGLTAAHGLPAAGRRIGVFPFRISAGSEYEHLDKALAELVSFRLSLEKEFTCLPAARLAGLAPSGKNLAHLRHIARSLRLKLFVSGTLQKNKTGIRFVIKVWRQGFREPYLSLDRQPASLGKLFDVVDECCALLQNRLHGISFRGQGGALSLDIALAVSTAPDMHRDMPGLADAVERLQNRLATASPAISSRMALLLYRNHAVMARCPSTRSRSRLLATIRRAQQESSRRPGDSHLLRQVLTLDWRPDALHILVVYGALPRKRWFSHTTAMAKLNLRVVAMAGCNNNDLRTAQDLSELARTTGGTLQSVDCLVNYLDEKQRERAFFLSKGLLYRIAHHVRDGWQQYGLQPAAVKTQPRLYFAPSLAQGQALVEQIRGGRIAIQEVTTNPEQAILNGLRKVLANQGLDLHCGLPKGKVWVRANGHTLWLVCDNSRILRRLQQQRGHKLWLGGQVSAASHHPQGMVINPHSLLLISNQKSIPDLVKVPYNRLQAQPRFYARHGLLYPNRWFFQARILRVEPAQGVRIRLEP